MLPVGGDHVTKDLSIILKTPTEQARKIKHQYGHAFYDDASDDELFEVPVIGADSKDQYSQRYISEIIGVRLEELFDLVIEELYKMGIRDLPGGVVLTGGITKIDGLLQLGKTCTKIKSSHTYARIYRGKRTDVYNCRRTNPICAYARRILRCGNREDHAAAAVAADAEAPVSNQKQATRKQGNKPSFFNKAKKVFDNFFE